MSAAEPGPLNATDIEQASLRASVVPAVPPEVVPDRYPTAGSGSGQANQRAESAGAFFLIGLVVGMAGGIGMFFLHLKRREAHYARHDAADYLFDDWPARPGFGERRSQRSLGTGSEADADAGSSDFMSGNAGDYNSTDAESSDEMIEQREPWERSVDWWKGDSKE